MAKLVLARSLRPKSFDEMYGQFKVIDAIKRQFKTGRVPQAYLFAGETGSGKTTIAKILGKSLQCSHGSKLGSYCRHCKDTDLFEINAADLNTVDAIKELAQGSNFGPVPPSTRRIYVLDEAQRITKQAQSILLKHTEDPPDTTVWIICTTEPESIILTLRSRCMIYYMQPLRGKELDRFVRYAADRGSIERDLSPYLDHLHLKGITSPRIVLYGLEKYAAGYDPEEAVSITECSIDTHRVCSNLLRGEWGPIRSELEKATPGDARAIRGAVLGYLRSVLLNRRPSANLTSVTWTIKEVGDIGFQDDASLLILLAGALWRAVKKF